MRYLLTKLNTVSLHFNAALFQENRFKVKQTKYILAPNTQAHKAQIHYSIRKKELFQRLHA